MDVGVRAPAANLPTQDYSLAVLTVITPQGGLPPPPTVSEVGEHTQILCSTNAISL